MLVVFVDFPPDDFTACFGASSYAEIMLFDKTLFTCMRSAVYPLIDTEYVIFSSDLMYDSSGAVVIKSVNELMDFIENSEQKTVVFFYLNTFISIDFNAINPSKIQSDNYIFSDENGCGFGCLLDRNIVINLLKNHQKQDLNFLLEADFLDKIQCIKYGQKLNNIKDYKRLCEYILTKDLSENLPEIAQGIYSSERIPSGDYTIIPPVYFGSDVQIEKGAVIGPCSVIYDGTLVSRNSIVDNSILLPDCFISKDCFLENCICCSNVSVRRASSIYSGAVIGADCIIAESSSVEKESCWVELSVEDNALNKAFSGSDVLCNIDTEQGIIEYSDNYFNMICKKSGGHNMKILLKAVSFEVAEEIISDLRGV